jgi:hypothetical protein
MPTTLEIANTFSIGMTGFLFAFDSSIRSKHRAQSLHYNSVTLICYRNILHASSFPAFPAKYSPYNEDLCLHAAYDGHFAKTEHYSF